MILSARAAIPANSGEEGENGPGYHRKTGRSGIRSGPARLSRCSAGDPSACMVSRFGVGDQDYRPRGVAARYVRDGARDLSRRLLVGHHDEVQDARPETQSAVVVHAELTQLALYLLDAHRAAVRGVPGLLDHGLLPIADLMPDT
jgi:hypothetical protein